jgi:hypothetical protein
MIIFMKKILGIALLATGIVVLILGAAFTASGNLSSYVKDTYRCVWKEGPYEYMFSNRYDAGDERVTIFGSEYGSFMAGSRGLLYYSGFIRCLGLELDMDSSDFYDTSPLEKASGVSFARKKGQFLFANPALIRWATANLVPEPSFEVDGVKAGKIYSVVFQRFARVMAETYVSLGKDFDYREEQFLYMKNIMGEPGMEAVDYLDKRFAGRFTHYEYGYGKFTALSVPMAYGFWIRRGIDGTDAPLWSALREILDTYDRGFLRKLEKKR